MMHTLRDFQGRATTWALKCFGAAVVRDLQERCYRFLEEALELVQSLGVTRDDALRLVAYVYDRPAGEAVQEAGGVMVTLAVLATTADLDLQGCADVELERCHAKIDVIRKKQVTKHIRSSVRTPEVPE